MQRARSDPQDDQPSRAHRRWRFDEVAPIAGLQALIATSPPRNASEANRDRAARRPDVRDLAWFAVAAMLTLGDAAATHLWLQSGIATEGNPVLVGYIEMLGVGVAMVGRAFWGLVLLVGLLVLVPHTRSAKQGLPVVASALILVSVLHLWGLVRFV